MDRFADLQTFVHVVEAGGIGAAAERMGIAKSAVSRRLAELETRLGAQLLRRTTRRLHLTDSGHDFLERARRVLADLDEAEQAVSSAQAALRGRVKVALPLAYGLLRLAPALREFMRRHPALEFDLDFNDRQIDLMQEGFDLAIRIANLPDSSLIARRLGTIRHQLCASPDYLARHGAPRSPDELRQHDCLVYSNPANPGIWHYHDPSGRAGSVEVRVALRANSGEFLLDAARAGFGLILMPDFYLVDSLTSGELTPVLDDHRWPELRVHAVYPPTRHLSRRLRALVDFLAERLTPEDAGAAPRPG